MAEWTGLSFTVRDDTLVARCLAGERSPGLDAKALRRTLADAGYGEWFLFDDGLAEAVKCYTGGTDEFEARVGEKRNGSVEIEIVGNAMSAYANIFPAQGGAPVTPTEVVSALRESGVKHGIDEAAIALACAQNKASQVTAAVGTPSKNGSDSTFEPLIDGTRSRTPRANEKGLIDFRDLGAIPIVEPGQPLMRRIPATLGRDGCNVKGESIPSVPGLNFGFQEPLIGVLVSPDDANLLVAACKGQPVMTQTGVSVEQIVQVEAVNMVSGNIDFDGTVIVEGEVMPGMKVRATGDIEVHSTVDGAELDADGNVTVHGGIIAHARVRAKGSISAKFVENAHLHAGTVIAIEDAALQSELEATNQIQVGVKSPQKGLLAGGSARATMLIEAPILGAENSGLTTLMVGVNPHLETAYQELLQRINKQQADEENLQKIINHLNTHGDKNNMLERACASFEQSAQKWAELLAERESMETQLELIKDAKITMSIGVEGPLEIAFGRKSLHFRQQTGAGAFIALDDQIALTDARGEHMRIR
jgi:uncharacterized protein (DUF342 family)